MRKELLNLLLEYREYVKKVNIENETYTPIDIGEYPQYREEGFSDFIDWLEDKAVEVGEV